MFDIIILWGIDVGVERMTRTERRVRPAETERVKMYKTKSQRIAAANAYDENAKRERLAAGQPSFEEVCTANAKKLAAEHEADRISHAEFTRCNAEISAAKSDILAITSDDDYQRMSPVKYKQELATAEKRLADAELALSRYYTRK